VVHRLLAGGPVRLRLSALCTWRDAHTSRYAGDGPLAVEPTTDGFEVEGAYRVAGPGFQPGGDWYCGAHLREEAARGLPPDEDLWYAGEFVADLSLGQPVEVTAWAGDVPPPRATRIVAGARMRAAEVTAGATGEPDALLRLAADQFIIDGPDVVAGYPWFGAWSRDTMISFTGLFLVTGRHAEGRELLRRYAGTLHEGLLANTADTGTPEYNTVDGTLWFVHALDEYVQATGDGDLAAELLPAVETIVDAHLRGTKYGIHVDHGDSLLTQGMPGYALTWMDACVGGVGITPRIGKPVEVNALWINALSVLASLRDRAGTDPAPIRALATAAGTSFRSRFVAPTGWLYDVVDGPDGDDASLRPNQLLAYALPHAPLRGERPPEAVAGELLTPLGLRSLAPDAPGYRPQHRGGPPGRDAAYHQGTVWPWLIGPFASARQAAGLAIDGLWDGLTAHLPEFGLGSVSETADGAAPHSATGCPFQAWSVAETLRAVHMAM
jgi:predicted glycogen debranching enzyme